MHSTPKKSSKSRGENIGDITNELPNVNEYVVNMFYQLGLCDRSGMGLSPVKWSDLKAYSDLSCSYITPREAELIMLMSRQYCLWYKKGSELSCPSPWFNDTEQAIKSNRERVANAMKAMRKNKAS